jgi:hypothetical protein
MRIYLQRILKDDSWVWCVVVVDYITYIHIFAVLFLLFSYISDDADGDDALFLRML